MSPMSLPRRSARATGRLGLVVVAAFVSALTVPPSQTIQPQAGRTLAFAENFDTGTGQFAYDDTWGCGFGSQSDFMGDLRQVRVENGIAIIEAQRQVTPCDREYASAVMSTASTFSTTYGYVEARIRFDRGTGLWPAFWMQPADGSWPPEIDIMEAYPNENGAWPGPARYIAVLHPEPSGDPIDVVVDAGVDLPGEWNVYAVDWQPGHLAFYFNGVEVGRISEQVPDVSMYVILNLAVGSWTAEADVSTPASATMEIDYVRVWR